MQAPWSTIQWLHGNMRTDYWEEYTFPSTHCSPFSETWVRGKSLRLVKIVNRIIYVYVHTKICSFFVTCLLFSRQVNQLRKWIPVHYHEWINEHKDWLDARKVSAVVFKTIIYTSWVWYITQPITRRTPVHHSLKRNTWCAFRKNPPFTNFSS
jgi:hypothetical protein